MTAAQPRVQPPRRRIPVAGKILLAMALGIVCGVLLGPRAAPLRAIGTVILDLIKGLAGPLLFLAVLDAFLRTRIAVRAAGRMIAIALSNACLAILIGLTISNVLQPGRFLALPRREAVIHASERLGTITKGLDPKRRIHFLEELLGMVPTSVLRPFLENTIISIVILAVLAGAALRRVKAEQQSRGEKGYRIVEEGVATSLRAVEVVMGWVIQLVPLAVFAVVAKTVGQEGLDPLAGLAVYLAVGILGLGIQVFVVYQAWLVVVARITLRTFWTGAREAVVYALGTGSSLATLPVTLRSLDRMGVSPQSARLAACVGTNLNNDGILLYEAMAVLFVAQACGLRLTLPEQLLAAASCALAGFGISGIPEAGLISLLLVMKTVKQIPDDQVALIVPMLLTVDWVLGRCRAMTNVTSDLLVAVLLDRFEPPGVDPEAQRTAARTGFAVLAGGDEKSDPDGI